MKKLFLALGLSVLCASALAKSNSNAITVTVKTIEGFASQVMHLRLKRLQANAIWCITLVEQTQFRVRN